MSVYVCVFVCLKFGWSCAGKCECLSLIRYGLSVGILICIRLIRIIGYTCIGALVDDWVLYLSFIYILAYYILSKSNVSTE